MLSRLTNLRSSTHLSSLLQPSQLYSHQLSGFSTNDSWDQFARQDHQRAGHSKLPMQPRRSWRPDGETKSENAPVPEQPSSSENLTKEGLSEAYMQKFNKKKGDVLQDWLEMSKDELAFQCKKLGLPVSEKQNENVVALFGFLNAFEKNISQQEPAAETVDGVFAHFGKVKQQQIDEWLELTNSSLMAECKKFGLTISEKHIHNIQSLFNYLKKFEEQKKRVQVAEQEKDQPKAQQTENAYFGSKQFNRRHTPTFDTNAQSSLAQEQVSNELGKIFARKESSLMQLQAAAKVPIDIIEVKGPSDSLPLNSFSIKSLFKASSIVFKGLQVPRQKKSLNSNNQLLKDLQLHTSLSYHERLVKSMENKNLLQRVFQMAPDKLHQEYTRVSQLTDNFVSLPLGKQQTALVNAMSIRNVELLQDVNQKFASFDWQDNQGQKFFFASQHFDQLNSANRKVLKSQLVDLNKALPKTELKKFQATFPSPIHIKAFVTLMTQQGVADASLGNLKYHLGNPSNYKITKPTKDNNQIYIIADAVATLNDHGLLTKESATQIHQQMSNFKLNETGKSRQVSAEDKNLAFLYPNESIMLQAVSNVDFNQFTTNKILYLTEHAINLNNIQINDQLLTALGKVPGARFNHEQCYKLMQQVLRLGNQADLDVTVGNLLFTRQIFTIPNSNELAKVLDLYEMIMKYQPFGFTKCKAEIKILITSSTQLAEQRERIPLEHMVRLTTLLTPSIVKPTFMFEAMLNKSESFAKDVAEDRLVSLLDAILNRLQQHRVTFDHLQTSVSMVHSDFVPYTGLTFQLLNKIISDGVPQHIANRILADGFVSTRLFVDAGAAREILMPMLTKMSEAKEEDLFETSSDSSQGSRAVGDRYKDLFQMLSNCGQIIPGPQTQALITSTIKSAIKKLQKDFAETSFSKDLPLLLSMNSALLNSIMQCETRKDLMQLYSQSLPLDKILQQIIAFQVKGITPTQDQQVPLQTQNDKENKAILAAITSQTWQQTERCSGDLIKYLLVRLESDQGNGALPASIVKDFLSQLSNSRSLYLNDLSNLFKLIEQVEARKLAKPQDFDFLLMNVASNLKTLGVNLFMAGQDSDLPADLDFQQLNKQELERDRSFKKGILQRYKQIFERSPVLFGKERQFSLSPLSSLMVELFDSFEHKDVLECMQLLGPTTIDNYSEEFIMKLYENYAQQAFMEKLFANNATFFFEFAKAWPQFLRNNAILNQLTRVKGATILVSDQSETIQILTRRNVLHPELMNLHLDTFIRMRDKDKVAQYMKQFLESCAYFGYTKNVNIEQLVQVYRRIYKTPDLVPIEELLNFLVMLAISNSYYNDFDEKSKVFIKTALDIVQEQYTGTQHVIGERLKDIKQKGIQLTGAPMGSATNQQFKLSFFKQITTSLKTYNKQAVRNSTKEIEDESERMRSAHFTPGTDPASGEESEVEGTETEDEVTDVQSITTDGETATQAPSRKSYERKASESSYQEDAEYLQFRNKKLAQLDKKGKHLLMYSNVNQLNFVDINLLPEAKAWTILFHFRSKSLQSMLFEEFNSVSQRNAISKTKSHQLFSQFYLKMMEGTYDMGLHIQMASSCERTGWPIDISMHSRAGSSGGQPQAVYFMLQEELCYNAQTKMQEPLGLQKLMVRHLEGISDYKVHFVPESDAISNLELCVTQLFQKMNAS